MAVSGDESSSGQDPEWSQADRFRKAREHAGLTQQKLADASGLSRQTISNYENGRTRPSLAHTRLWALSTGVDLPWLRGDPLDGEEPRSDRERLKDETDRFDGLPYDDLFDADGNLAYSDPATDPLHPDHPGAESDPTVI